MRKSGNEERDKNLESIISNRPYRDNYRGKHRFVRLKTEARAVINELMNKILESSSALKQ